MKKIVYIIILSVCMLLLVGCMKKTYTVEWTGWEIIPKEPVINEQVLIHVKYYNESDGNRTLLFHWVITEGSTQREFTTAEADLFVTFDSSGDKEVFLWAEGVNYGESFAAKPYFFEFTVAGEVSQ